MTAPDSLSKYSELQQQKMVKLYFPIFHTSNVNIVSAFNKSNTFNKFLN